MMDYLLDTCVLSEFTRRLPDNQVINWIGAVEEERLHLCVITLGEIQRGIERLPESTRKSELLTWLNEKLLKRFEGRLVSIEATTMLLWGALTARLDSIGQPMSVMDSLIAACALHHGMTLVTRNITDFSPSGVKLINPWGE